MERSLPVVWSVEAEQGPGVGKLELLPDRLRLEGRRRGRRVVDEFQLSEVGATHFGRSEAERLGGRSTLVIERPARRSLLVCALFGFGALAELADQLSAWPLQ
jgi:hypothetical protein